jgi:2-oxo-4-hydroxy-4-carboxy-5-ureidoimidazoline decarboxylase
VTLLELNTLPAEEAWRALQLCCGAEAWIEYVCEHRPHSDRVAIERASASAFDAFDEDDWLEAFAHHPQIGDIEALRAKFAHTAAGEEQGGVAQADDATLADLAARNVEYQKRFGFIFIVFATGKSAAEMLELLQGRLGNDRATELRNAAEEQRKITALRLDRMLAS